MIDIKELRCGNFVNNLLDDEPEIWALTHFRKIHDYSMELSEYGFIRITEEWLIKFGFDESKNTKGVFEYIDVENALKLFKSPHGDIIYIQCVTGTISVLCEFVHQLQNLFYALSGVELQIKK